MEDMDEQIEGLFIVTFQNDNTIIMVDFMNVIGDDCFGLQKQKRCLVN